MTNGTCNDLTMFDMDFSPATLEEATDEILSLVGGDHTEIIVTPNVDHIVMMEHDKTMFDVFKGARYRYADGMPLVWLSRLRFNKGLPERVTGADLLFSVSEGAARKGASIFLLGAMPGVAETAADNLRTQYPSLSICGVYSPPFGFDQDDDISRDIVARVNAARPRILFVGVGTPKQEKWAHRWRKELNCDVVLGVGAAIDFAAGTARRAPRPIQKAGLEWLWRVANDPFRLLPRYFNDRKFFGLALQELRNGVRRPGRS